MVRAEGGRRNRRFLSAAVTSGTGDARGRKEQQGAWGRARRHFKEVGRGEDAPTTRNVGTELLRLTVDWRGESGRKGNALMGGARWSATEDGRRRGGSCLAELGRGAAASRELGRPKNGRRKNERAAGRKWASSPVGEKGQRAEMKKGGERNEETFFFLFLEFFKSIFKWI